ncbi:MAG: hypothetical protein ACJASM_002041 [Salibacteraceae bacterium]|jgi:hypothetical protein
MTQADVKRLALVLSVQAEIEGMKAENHMRKIKYESLAYTDQDFVDKSNDLQNIANMHDDQI